MGGLAIMIRDPDGQLIELTTFAFHDMRPPWPELPASGSGRQGWGDRRCHPLDYAVTAPDGESKGPAPPANGTIFDPEGFPEEVLPGFAVLKCDNDR